MLVEHDKARDAKVKDIVEQTVHSTVEAIMRQGSAHMQMLEQYMSQIAHSAVQTAIGQAQAEQEQYEEEQREALCGYEDVYSSQHAMDPDSSATEDQYEKAARLAMEALRPAGPGGGAAAAAPTGGANVAGQAQAATEQEGHKGDGGSGLIDGMSPLKASWQKKWQEDTRLQVPVMPMPPLG